MAENWWLIRRQLPGENVSPAIKSAGKWMKNHRIRRLLKSKSPSQAQRLVETKTRNWRITIDTQLSSRPCSNSSTSGVHRWMTKWSRNSKRRSSSCFSLGRTPLFSAAPSAAVGRGKKRNNFVFRLSAGVFFFQKPPLHLSPRAYQNVGHDGGSRSSLIPTTEHHVIRSVLLLTLKHIDVDLAVGSSSAFQCFKDFRSTWLRCGDMSSASWSCSSLFGTNYNTSSKSPMKCPSNPSLRAQPTNHFNQMSSS